MSVNQSTKMDPKERQEWHQSLLSIVEHFGQQVAFDLLMDLQGVVGKNNLESESPYLNTISAEQFPAFPKDLPDVKQISAINRWNAACMVVKAARQSPHLGGHLSSFASISNLYEVGWHYFFRGRKDSFLGDMVFYQGHSSPGIYAHAFLEGRLKKEHLLRFRREVGGEGLSSYPHPRLMPDFWQFPTVSMGLGPLQSIYQARFMRYLEQRQLLEKQGRKIWVFCGDGEMDEPESLSGLSLAGREALDSLVFVVNCNLQRLDGPVRGNGKIVQELERQFKANHWTVIKVLWSQEWDALFAADEHGIVQQRIASWVDGETQNFQAANPQQRREMLFGGNDELVALSERFSDQDLAQLNRGGHDPQLVYSAYHKAHNHQDSPIVILAQTVKGFGLGEEVAVANIAHNHKKMSEEQMLRFGTSLGVPLDKEAMEQAEFYRPDSSDSLMSRMQDRRSKLFGPTPQRIVESNPMHVPELKVFESLLEASEKLQSTTMVFVRFLMILLRQKDWKQRVVPIVPDESRTFGMEGLFKQIGIYASQGQQYQPIDYQNIMPYRESEQGQLLQEGIDEAGAMCSWLAAATSYAQHGLPMVPFYIYYSMFGFQRIGDLAWAAGDICARGFLLGATAGRTTLEGEGLQHCDGHSHVLASTIPNCVSYDPAYSYEVAVIFHHGLKTMFQDQKNVFFYITLMNENYTHPKMLEGAQEGIIAGMYCLKEAVKTIDVTLLGSGAILNETIKARELLREWGVDAEVWSVTSYTELARQAKRLERTRSCFPEKKAQESYVSQCLNKHSAPVVAASDYMRSHAEQIRSYLKREFHVLGTDGFGRSDTREELRSHFEVDAANIAYRACVALQQSGQLSKDELLARREQLGLNFSEQDPLDA